MAFLLDGQPLAVDTPFKTSDGTQFPANWLRVSSEEEKKAVGISWEPDPTPADQRFYWDHGIPKDIEDLKKQWIAEQKQTAGTLLAPTDWYITRQFETDLEVPAEILDYRAAVRNVSGERELQIAACKSVSDLEGLVTGGGFEEWPTLPE